MNFAKNTFKVKSPYLINNKTLILTASKPSLKPRLVAVKSQYYPTTCTAVWGGGGEGGCFHCSPEDLLNKN
jgi:hypothetical protein